MIKKLLCNLLVLAQTDNLFRFINRKKVLIVMYHGVTRNNYSIPVWTQLPEQTFRKHIKFIKNHYRVLSLSEFLKKVASPKNFSERTALITFDDGLENNYSVAYQILKEFEVPATIFLTTKLIGTEKLLWFDELYYIFHNAFYQGVSFSNINGIHNSQNNIWWDYFNAVEKLKIMSEDSRNRIIDQFKSKVNISSEGNINDFKLLSWEQVKEMYKSGLIDFGAHTANHNILTTLHPSEWHNEMNTPKIEMEGCLNTEILSFCFPNGRPQTDYREEHISFLKESGYQLAFTTESLLFSPKQDDAFQIGRKSAGNDITSYPPYFKLSISGFFEYLKN